jgi:lysyl-tRNA synthetase class 2
VTEEEDLPEQQRVRRDKLDRLRAAGIEPYPVGFRRTTTLGELSERFSDLAPDATTGERVAVAGRVIFARDTGKLAFARLSEGDAELQVMLSADRLGADSLAAFTDLVDLGDQVGVAGEVGASRRGELSVLADSWTMIAKALRPLPALHKPLSEETRVRQRYVDLIVRPEARRMARLRAAVLASLRETLAGRGYLEVETPMLQLIHGGAAARPFTSHLNAFDLDVHLRIATELHLKRLLVGGLDRVYEMGRTFRNEGVDSSHSPEFTELEAYEAYGDYDTMAELTQALIQQAAHAVLGTTVVPGAGGGELDLGGTWRHVTLHDAVSERLGEPLTPDTDEATCRRVAERARVPVGPEDDAGEIALELYEKLVEPTIVEPTFVRDYPASVRPLARPHRDDPRLAEAWDLVIDGVEIAPAYSELADPIEQRARLTAQSLRAAGGDPEAMALDEDFLRALEYGMPPAGGMGLGVDRLLMLLTGAGIRETILFPLVRPD